MAHNTMYKHLAKHIKAQRDKDPNNKVRQEILDELVFNFGREMEERQPGSFDRVTFLEQAGASEVVIEGEIIVEATVMEDE